MITIFYTGLTSLIIDLTVFCASKLNDTKMNYHGTEVVSPDVRGVVCDSETGIVSPAWFNDDARTPIIDIRGVRSLTAVEFFPNVFKFVYVVF